MKLCAANQERIEELEKEFKNVNGNGFYAARMHMGLECIKEGAGND